MKILGRHRKFKNAAGFTLIEVLVAVVVIAVGCLLVLNVHFSTIRGGSQADSGTVASFLAESQIELLRSLEFDDIEDAVNAMGGGGTACFSGQVNSCDGAGFNACYTECLTRAGDDCPAGGDQSGCFKRTTGLITATPTSRTHTVRVTVEWRGPTRDHAVMYDSMISAFGFTQ